MNFGQNDAHNVPPAITDTMLRNGLSGKASEKWCLFRLLPQLIGHLVPAGNSAWNVYILSREIAEYLMAPVIRKSWIAYLGNLITQLLELLPDYLGEFSLQIALHNTLPPIDVIIWTITSFLVYTLGRQSPIFQESGSSNMQFLQYSEIIGRQTPADEVLETQFKNSPWSS